MDCILGADFLSKHGAVLDCTKKSLQLCSVSSQCTIPLCSPERPGLDEVYKVVMRHDIEIKGRHVQCISAAVQNDKLLPLGAGLVEPIELASIPNHLLCARALCVADHSGFVPVKICNSSQQPITLHRGTKIASFHPIQNIYVVENDQPVQAVDNAKPSFSDADLGHDNLNPDQ